MGHIDLGMLQKLSHRPMTDPDGLLWRLISEIIERRQKGADTSEPALLIAAFPVRIIFDGSHHLLYEGGGILEN